MQTKEVVQIQLEAINKRFDDQDKKLDLILRYIDASHTNR
jgi:hypothetical protein